MIVPKFSNNYFLFGILLSFFTSISFAHDFSWITLPDGRRVREHHITNEKYMLKKSSIFSSLSKLRMVDFTATPWFSYSKIDFKNSTTGVTGELLSETNFGLNFNLMAQLKKKLKLGTNFRFSKYTYSSVSNSIFTNRSNTLLSTQVGAEYLATEHISVSAWGGLWQELYFGRTSFNNINLEKKLNFGVLLKTKYLSSNKRPIMAEGRLRYLPSGLIGLGVGSGIVIWNKNRQKVWAKIDLNYEQKNTDLFDQSHSEIMFSFDWQYFFKHST